MNLQLSLLLLLFCLPGYMSASDRNLVQFREMIKCTLPDSNPLVDFGDYGCYCGLGGGGEAVDQLDRCCLVHDNCYGLAQNHSACDSILDSPYTNIYDFTCNEASRTISCLSSNDECDLFICECDRVAAECFAGAPYNASNNNLPSGSCNAAPGVPLPPVWVHPMTVLLFVWLTLLERTL
ncbi:phospholipase A2, minor isoenzyme-like [Engraulis encrasicolus]|uniref:phospholipase A2, minor isoenzyme-like n=1 Tax=Engraulis encrasicolus TaxID=184585 RepID=UPI002FD1A11F